MIDQAELLEPPELVQLVPVALQFPLLPVTTLSFAAPFPSQNCTVPMLVTIRNNSPVPLGMICDW